MLATRSFPNTLEDLRGVGFVEVAWRALRSVVVRFALQDQPGPTNPQNREASENKNTRRESHRAMGEGEDPEKQGSNEADSTAPVGGGSELASSPPASPKTSASATTADRNVLPPLSPNNPTTKPQHKRNVSWGYDAKPLVDKTPSQNGESPKASKPSSFELDSETLSHITTPILPDPSANRQTKSMADLVNAIRKNPLESEAESYVLSAVEERDKFEESSPSSALLSGVPDESANLFKLEAKGSDSGSLKSGTNHGSSHSRPTPAKRNVTTGSHPSVNSQRKHKKPHHVRGSSTMEETLAGLTTQLAGLHSKERKAYGVPSMTAKQVEQDKILLDDPNAGSGDTLRKATNILFRGKMKDDGQSTPAQTNWRKISSSLKAAEKDAEISSADKQGPTAKDNWSKLRHAMLVSSIAAQHKKDDSSGGEDEIETPMEDEFDLELGDDGGSDYESGDEKGDGKGRRKKRLEKAVKESIVGDFQVFVGQRKSALWAYLKVLIFVVIPAIGIACILFYLADNAPTGVIDLENSNSTYRENTNDEVIEITQASYSYWILFIAVRQFISFR